MKKFVRVGAKYAVNLGRVDAVFVTDVLGDPWLFGERGGRAFAIGPVSGPSAEETLEAFMVALTSSSTHARPGNDFRAYFARDTTVDDRILAQRELARRVNR